MSCRTDGALRSVLGGIGWTAPTVRRHTHDLEAYNLCFEGGHRASRRTIIGSSAPSPSATRGPIDPFSHVPDSVPTLGIKP